MLKRVLFPVVALLLSVLVIALGWQNRQLRQINEQMATQLQDMRLAAHGLELGSRPDALALRTTQQTFVDIGGAREVPQILYFFSTACRYCLASVPQLQQIAAARGNSELVGVGMPPYDQLADYAGKHALRFPIAIDNEAAASTRYRATRHADADGAGCRWPRCLQACRPARRPGRAGCRRVACTEAGAALIPRAAHCVAAPCYRIRATTGTPVPSATATPQRQPRRYT